MWSWSIYAIDGRTNDFYAYDFRPEKDGVHERLEYESELPDSF
jgi:hypothetical protein